MTQVTTQVSGSTQGKKPSESYVEMTEIVLPQHTNVFGTIFGGVVLSWVDIAAAICALRHSGKAVVTASFDAMNFLAPIGLGWIVSIKASVNYVSRSSCEVGVRIMAENPMTREHHHTASAYVTMVALDKDGHPSPMPPLILTSEVEKRRHEEASTRRQTRLELKGKFAARKKT